MRRLPLLAAAALAAACAGLRAGDAGAAFQEDVLRFADWCAQKGAVSQARQACAYLLDLPESEASAPFRERAAAALRALPASKPSAAAAAERKALAAEVLRLVQGASARYVEASKALSAAGREEEATRAMQSALVIWEDEPEARRLRGEERVEGFGWAASAEAERLRAATVDLAKLPLPGDAAKADPLHRRWESAWVVRSDHYVIRSNRPLLEIAQFARLTELLYRSFFQFAGSRVERPAERMAVYLFADKADYERHRNDAFKDRSFSAHHVAGYYDAGSRIAAFYARPPAGNEPEGSLAARHGPDAPILLHECVHQILHLGHRGRLPTRLPFLRHAQQDQIHYWIVEGIACLFESCDLAGGKLEPSRKGPRYARIARRVAQGDLPDLSEWMAMEQDGFMRGENPSRSYDLAGALCHYFLHFAGGQKYRERLFLFLSAHYQGEVGLETFQKLFGSRIDLLQAEFEDYARETWGGGNDGGKPPAGD